MGHELLWRELLWEKDTVVPVNFITNFTWLLEADQPHQHCSSDHPGPALAWRGTACTYMAPAPSMSGQRNSAGQPDVRQGVFTHTCSPGHSSASFWMMSTTATRKSQANWNPSSKRRMLCLLTAPSHSSPGDAVVTHTSVPAHGLNCWTSSISPVNQAAIRNLTVCWKSSPTWVAPLLIS